MQTLARSLDEDFSKYFKIIFTFIFRNTDTIVQIGADEFNCHRIVLQIYSSYFDRNGQRKIDLSSVSKWKLWFIKKWTCTHKWIFITQANITPETFRIIYEWMLFSGTESNKVIKRDNVLALLCAAQYLEIKGDLVILS